MKILKFAVVVLGISVALSTIVGPVANARVDAVYEVPTDSADLMNAAKFTARSNQDLYGSPERNGKLNFALPEELTGKKISFELLKDSTGAWAGDGTDGSKVSGSCARTAKKWFSCTVAFSGLNVDEPQRDRILTKQFGTGVEFSQRLTVARFFEGQPIGIIRVRMGR